MSRQRRCLLASGLVATGLALMLICLASWGSTLNTTPKATNVLRDVVVPTPKELTSEAAFLATRNLNGGKYLGRSGSQWQKQAKLNSANWSAMAGTFKKGSLPIRSAKLNIKTFPTESATLSNAPLPSKWAKVNSATVSVTTTSERTFAARRGQLMQSCREGPLTPKDDLKGLFKHKKSGVIYCTVPKVGCTFWKRIFRVANQKNPSEKDSVFGISRLKVHYVMGPGNRYNASTDSPAHFPTRFTVTRDPFSRLLSAYLDKVYLPDFWHHFPRHLVRLRWRAPSNNAYVDALNRKGKPDFLRLHFDDMASRYNTVSFRRMSTANETLCAKYITFAEFIEISFLENNEHWMPIHQMCDPCRFKVTHLGYMETFTEDARAILGIMGFGNLIDEMDRDSQVNEEITMLVNFAFSLWGSRRNVRQCSSIIEVAYRLWVHFQWRGYIDPDMQYQRPRQPVFSDVKRDMEKQLWFARKSGLLNRSKMKAAKQKFFIDAYRSLNPSAIRRLLEKYNTDINLYHYERYRVELLNIVNMSNHHYFRHYSG